jgi:hypothetical protein
MVPQLIVVKNTAFVKLLEAEGSRSAAGPMAMPRSSSLKLTRNQRNKLDYAVFPPIASAILQACKEQSQKLSLLPPTGAYKWPPLLQLSAQKEVLFDLEPPQQPQDVCSRVRGGGEVCRIGICRSVLSCATVRSSAPSCTSSHAPPEKELESTKVMHADSENRLDTLERTPSSSNDGMVAYLSPVMLLATATASNVNSSFAGLSVWNLVPHDSGEISVVFRCFCSYTSTILFVFIYRAQSTRFSLGSVSISSPVPSNIFFSF